MPCGAATGSTASVLVPVTDLQLYIAGTRAGGGGTGRVIASGRRTSHIHFVSTFHFHISTYSILSLYYCRVQDCSRAESAMRSGPPSGLSAPHPHPRGQDCVEHIERENMQLV